MVDHIGSLSLDSRACSTWWDYLSRGCWPPRRDNSSERKTSLLMASLYLLGIAVLYREKILSPVNYVAVYIVA